MSQKIKKNPKHLKIWLLGFLGFKKTKKYVGFFSKPFSSPDYDIVITYKAGKLKKTTVFNVQYFND